MPIYCSSLYIPYLHLHSVVVSMSLIYPSYIFSDLLHVHVVLWTTPSPCKSLSRAKQKCLQYVVVLLILISGSLQGAWRQDTVWCKWRLFETSQRLDSECLLYMTLSSSLKLCLWNVDNKTCTSSTFCCFSFVLTLSRNCMSKCSKEPKHLSLWIKLFG